MIRCRMPPENSCGYCSKRVGGMPIRPSVSSERRRDLARRQLRLVLLERLLEVLGDPHQRIQPCHRLLEDQAELRAAEAAEVFCGEARRGSGRRRCTSPSARAPFGQQTEDAAAERRLAAARLADEADHFALADVERDVVDRAHRRPGVP